MASLSTILPVTLKFEGGFADNPRDPGGATMKGVTLTTYRRYAPKATVADLKAISDQELMTIYNDGYFAPIGGPELNQGVAMAAFDYAVNSGVGRAKPALVATASQDPVTRVKSICVKRLSFLHALTNWKYFGKGWGARVASVEATSIKWASGLNAQAELKTAAKEAQASMSKKASVSAGSVTSGAVASAPAVNSHIATTQTNYTVLAIFVVVAVVVAGIAGFLAYRQSQRVTALTAAANGG